MQKVKVTPESLVGPSLRGRRKMAVSEKRPYPTEKL